MRNASEVVREVGINDFRVAAKQQRFHVDHRLLGIAPRTIGILLTTEPSRNSYVLTPELYERTNAHHKKIWLAAANSSLRTRPPQMRDSVFRPDAM